MNYDANNLIKLQSFMKQLDTPVDLSKTITEAYESIFEASIAKQSWFSNSITNVIKWISMGKFDVVVSKQTPTQIWFQIELNDNLEKYFYTMISSRVYVDSTLNKLDKDATYTDLNEIATAIQKKDADEIHKIFEYFRKITLNFEFSNEDNGFGFLMPADMQIVFTTQLADFNYFTEQLGMRDIKSPYEFGQKAIESPELAKQYIQSVFSEADDNIHEVLMHELEHIIDFYVRRGILKSHMSKTKQLQQKQSKSQEEYRNLPSELNAWRSGMVSRITTTMKRSPDLTFKELMGYMTRYFDLLPEKWKRKYYKEAYSMYNVIKQNR